MSATPPEPPYAVVARPGPGLATITDRRDGKTRLWSRTLGGGPRGRNAASGPRRCANCGTTIRRAFYKPPERNPPIADRLCLACIEGDDAGQQERC